MHPSGMPSFFAPPMPFQPEELHKHVKQLEHAYAVLPGDDLNARTAVAKAIVAAVGAFIEGSLAEQGGAKGLPGWAATKRGGLWPCWEALRTAFPSATSPDIWTRNDAEMKRLKTLRNDVDHGNIVEQSRLSLERPTAHREAAIVVLTDVYAALGSNRPGWW